MSNTEKKNQTIKTLDGKEMEKGEARVVNPDRLWFVAKLLRERLHVDHKADVKALIQTCTMPERTANLKLVAAAEALLATMDKKGLAGYAIADVESVMAKMLANLLTAPDVSTPPKHWNKDKDHPFVVPNLFVPYIKAEEKWLENQAALNAEKAKRDAKTQAARAEAEKKEREAQAERDRQAAVKSEAADVLFAMADATVVATETEEREERKAQAEEVKAARNERLEKAREFFRKAINGELSALGFKNTKSTPPRWFVSRDDNDILSLHRIAELAGADPETIVRSAVHGSIFAGKLGDNHTSQSGKVLSNWMCAKFTVRLKTADGRPLKDSAQGYVIMDSREGTTMKIVAQELGILDTENEDSQKKFWETYRLQTLSKAAEYEANTSTRRRDQKNGNGANPTPTPEPEPTNGNGKDQTRGKKAATPRRKSDEDGKQNAGRPERVPEIEIDDSNIIETVEEPAIDTAPTDTMGNGAPLTHSPFAAAFSNK